MQKFDNFEKLSTTISSSSRSLNSERGMTLVEIMVVIVLFGLIMGVVASKVTQNARVAEAEMNAVKMRALEGYLSTYKVKFGKYPRSLQYLAKQPPEANKKVGLYVPPAREEDLIDVWHSPYMYSLKAGGKGYSIGTLGADGVVGGEGADQDYTISK